MPNNKNERKGKQTGELSAEERFRNFFSTSVIDLPEEMTHRDEPAPVEEKPKAGLLGKLFGHDKEETPAAAQPVLEIPTGEILLGADAKPVQPEQEDMALELRTADPVPVMPLQFARTEPVKAVPAEPVPAPKAAAAVQPAPEKPVPQPAAAPQKQPKAKNAPETLLPQEELEQREMQQLKDMLNGMSGKAKPAVHPAKPVQAAPQPKVQPAPAQPAAEPEKAPAKAAQKAAEELPPVVFASAPADPETLPKKPEKKSIFQMFGTAEDEKPAAHKPEKEDTMSLPLLPLEQDGAPAEPAPAPADAAPAAPAQPETAPEAAVPTEEAVPESIADKLHHMAAELTLRCVLAGILAVVLLHLGLTAERLLPPLSVLDPDAAPAAFYAANLLLFAASLFVGYPVLRDGLTGLRGRPSADTMPALAAVAALLQAVVAMLNANAYRSTEGIGLLTGMAALAAKLTPLSASAFSSAANMILLGVGLIFLGKKFAMTTGYATVVMSLELMVLEKICPLRGPLSDQPMLDLLFAIALPAIASALLFNVGASSGGTDVIALIVEKYTHIHNVAVALFLTDLFMVIAACFVFDLYTALYSFVGLTVKSLVIDAVLEKIKMCKAILIVCDDRKPICDFVMRKLVRGATYTPCFGAYTDKPHYIIYTTLTRREADQLQDFIHKQHLNAFMSMLSTTEVFGKGFNHA